MKRYLPPNTPRLLFLTGLLLLLLLSGVRNSAAGTAPQKGFTPPLGERWFVLSLNGEQTGFVHQRIDSVADGYEVASDSSVKMVVLGFTREAAAHERYLVKPDLSIRSFTIEQVLDGSIMKLSGVTAPKGIKVTVTTAGVKKEKLLKNKGAVYPGPLINLYPLLFGATASREYRLNYLDAEAVKVKEVKIKVAGPEKLQDGHELIRMSNDLYPFVSNDVWIDREGNTVQESVRDGMIVTRAVDEASGRKFLAEAAVAKSDLVLDFSLIRLEPPLKRQKELKGLVVEFDRIPVGIELPQGVAQKVEHAGSALRVRTATDSAADSPEASIPPIGDELATSDRIQSDNQEIIALGKDIVAKETDPVKMVALLARWVDRNVEDAVIDSHSALETLRIRKGNCQSHTRLYTAFARSLGIPTRFVSGLVHVEGKGFLYHSWAESFVGRWITVDPTFGQIPADATHVKIVTGESADAMAALAGIIGRITARVVETTY